MGTKLELDPSWYGRRQVVRWTLLSCLGLSGYSVYHSVEMAAVVLLYTSGLAGAVIGSYVFGAAWERTRGIPSESKYVSN